MSIKALTNARIIDCTGADPIENGAVIIEGERIKEVLEAGPGAGCRRDAAGHRLPGAQPHPGPNRLPRARGFG